MSDHKDEILISIIVPVWNRATLIAQAIGSVKGPAAPIWEIIVVDDGSTDTSAAAARIAAEQHGLADRVRVITQANAGPGPARNRAVAEARGTYIACLDSDDIWFPWTLPSLIDLVRAQPDTGAWFFRAKTVTDRTQAMIAPATERPMVTRTHQGFLEAFLAESTVLFFATSVFMCRRAVFEAAGGFSDKLRVAEDLDFFLRLPLELPVTIVAEPALVAYFTSTDGSLTKSFEAAYQGLEVLRASEAAGLYPGGARQVRSRNIFLARVTTFTILNGWLNRKFWHSYGLFLRNIWQLANNRCRMFILRYHAMIAQDLWRALRAGGRMPRRTEL